MHVDSTAREENRTRCILGWEGASYGTLHLLSVSSGAYFPYSSATCLVRIEMQFRLGRCCKSVISVIVADPSSLHMHHFTSPIRFIFVNCTIFCIAQRYLYFDLETAIFIDPSSSLNEQNQFSTISVSIFLWIYFTTSIDKCTFQCTEIGKVEYEQSNRNKSSEDNILMGKRSMSNRKSTSTKPPLLEIMTPTCMHNMYFSYPQRHPHETSPIYIIQLECILSPLRRQWAAVASIYNSLATTISSSNPLLIRCRKATPSPPSWPGACRRQSRRRIRTERRELCAIVQRSGRKSISIMIKFSDYYYVMSFRSSAPLAFHRSAILTCHHSILSIDQKIDIVHVRVLDAHQAIFEITSVLLN